MLDLANRLSLSPELFIQECRDPKNIFLKLKYAEKLIVSTFNRLHTSQNQDQNCIAPIDSPVRITLPFKDQKSANVVHRELRNLGRKIGHVLQPVFTSRKIPEHFRVTETKPSLVTQQCVVYELKCNSRDANPPPRTH